MVPSYEMKWSFLNSLDLSSLCEEQIEIMTVDITEDELKVAISRHKLSKSPGSDGYTATTWLHGQLEFSLQNST